MILVIGATGLLGMEICRRLRSAGTPVRALIRSTADAAKRAELEALQVQLVEGDLKDRASLDRLCAGVRAVISTASSTLSRQEGDSIRAVDEQGQQALVDAARSAGVEQFVFVSFRGKPNIQFPLIEAKRAVEQHLKTSGISYTILHASCFMEVWLSPMLGFDYLHGKVRIYGEGTNKLSWVSYKDVATIAAAALEQPLARNATFDVGGPEALSPDEVVRVFETAGFAQIATEHVAEADLSSRLLEATDPLEQSFAGLMLHYAIGDAMDVTRTRNVFPIEMTSVREYVSALLASN